MITSERMIADLNALGLYADDRWGTGEVRAMADDFELLVRRRDGAYEVGPNAFPPRRGVPFPSWREALAEVRGRLREHEEAMGWRRPGRARRSA